MFVTGALMDIISHVEMSKLARDAGELTDDSTEYEEGIAFLLTISEKS